jgi:hypothetical protein
MSHLTDGVDDTDDENLGDFVKTRALLRSMAQIKSARNLGVKSRPVDIEATPPSGPICEFRETYRRSGTVS